MGQKWFKPQLPKYSLNTNIHRMRGNGSFLSATLEVKNSLGAGRGTDFHVAI